MLRAVVDARGDCTAYCRVRGSFMHGARYPANQQPSLNHPPSYEHSNSLSPSEPQLASSIVISVVHPTPLNPIVILPAFSSTSFSPFFLFPRLYGSKSPRLRHDRIHWVSWLQSCSCLNPRIRLHYSPATN